AMVTEFDRRRQFLVNALRVMGGVSFNYPRGAFYLFLHVKPYLNSTADGKKIKTSDDWCEYFLMKHLVAMVPGSGFGANDWVRISYACSMSELERAVERLRRGVEQLQ
ncbi:MAG: aminotransferase class I/II-fold pyridoxal phosphate-dependent enzyme, partial [Bacteroidota bacterium]